MSIIKVLWQKMVVINEIFGIDRGRTIELKAPFIYFETVVSADYIKAGQEMCNCLGETYQPVVIKSKENYVAAISLDTGNHKIIQSALSKNYPIYNNSPVFSAIEKWCKRYNVDWS